VNSFNATTVFPWLQRANQLEKRTLKIEVTFREEVILLRFIHLDKLFPVEYPKRALQIAHNMIQNNIMMQNSRNNNKI
jgi:hypothetical protein